MHRKTPHLFIPWILLFLAVGTFGTIQAQDMVQVKGQVIDQEDGQALPGVYILLSEKSGAVTDIQGRFALDIPKANTELQFKMVGYEKQTVKLEFPLVNELAIKLKRSTLMLDQVVVSAGRYDQEVAKVTVSMEVLSPQLVRNKNLITLDEALREVPGMIIVDNEPQIRSGSGYSFGAGSRVAVLLDGVPQLSGDIGRPTWSSLPMEAVEQVEVIKGASSVLYGSAALSGVVHLRTMYPKDKPYTRFDFFNGAYARPASKGNDYWGSSNMTAGRTILHSQRVGNTDIVASVNLISDDGHLGPIVDSLGNFNASSNVGSANYYAAERWARGWVKLEHKSKLVKGFRYGITLSGMKSISVAALLWDNIDTGLYKAVDGSATTTRQVRTGVNPYAEYLTKGGNKWVYKANWNKLDNDNDNNQGNFSDSYFQELQYQLNGEQLGVKGLHLVSGLAYTLNTSESELFTNLGQQNTHESTNLGAYVQADKELWQRVNLNLGMRWERFTVDKEEESKPVFRSGVNVQVGRGTFFRASYGQGFRFPTIGERFITTSVGTLTIYPNPTLQAETSTNMEVGVKQGFAIGDFKGYIDLVMFRQDFKDFIEFTFGQWADTSSFDNFLGLGFTSLNTGKAQVNGYELSIAAKGDLSKQSSLTILMGYTYSKPFSKNADYVYARSHATGIPVSEFNAVTYYSSSSDRDGAILKYRMQHIAKMNLDLQTGAVNTGISLRYNSYMKNIDRIFESLDEDGLLVTGVTQWRDEHDKGDLIMDARIGYTFAEKHRVSLIVDNVFNREYAIRPLALERNRRVIIQLSFQF
jgi:outer membrane receptor protein involved in Fe transport